MTNFKLAQKLAARDGHRRGLQSQIESSLASCWKRGDYATVISRVGPVLARDPAILDEALKWFHGAGVLNIDRADLERAMRIATGAHHGEDERPGHDAQRGNPAPAR